MTCSSVLAMGRYSIEPRATKYVKNMDFYHLQKNIYKKNIGYKTRFFKNCFQTNSP